MLVQIPEHYSSLKECGCGGGGVAVVMFECDVNGDDAITVDESR
jgi:hypothetical protein